MTPTGPEIGAWLRPDGTARLRVWAPDAARVEAHLVDRGRVVPLAREGPTTTDGRHRDRGYWQAVLPDLAVGDRYALRVDGGPDRPDPAGFAQPEGVHGPSAVVAPDFDWTDDGWQPPPLAEWVIMEVHVGTATPAGTFEGLVARLDDLADVGVNVLEVMPIAEFPGDRNWGYDGVDLFAVHHAYGGLDGFRALVDACHARGIAVVLDVVYNHLGPEGNYLGEFGPYFTDRYRTPWGDALDFDGPGSDEVRGFFVENARFWATHAHVDGFRLDAVHAIVDATAYPFVEELTAQVHARADELGRPLTVIAESADNDSLLAVPTERGGRGLDAQWSDGFHHALHVALTGERDGYYVDFEGIGDLAATMEHGFVYRNRYSPFRGRRHGRPSPPPPLDRLVVFAQNHDQIGNRARGERLAELLDFEALKVAMACTLLAPSIPLLFQGGEEAEERPFPYFTSHGDPALVEAVRRGRAEEFDGFAGQAEPLDPQDPETFARAVLEPAPRTGHRAAMRTLVRDLIDARRTLPALDLRRAEKPVVAADVHAGVLDVKRGRGGEEVRVIARFGDRADSDDAETTGVRVTLDGTWHVRLDTAAPRYAGPREPSASAEETYELAPTSVALLTRAPHTAPG